MGRRGFLFWTLAVLVGLGLLLAAATFIWRDDILRTALDPRVPYQTYEPPPAPDYARPVSWALLPRPQSPPSGGADVFFIHPTTYAGGEHWNAPVDDRDAAAVLARDMLPNYAGPYQRVGRVFAPRYRQASLYTELTLRDDAREARRFAYGDIQAAFWTFRNRHNRGRPFLLVGAGQGGTLAARLLAEEIAGDAELRARFLGAHLIETVTPELGGVPPCRRPDQAGCVVAYASVGPAEREGAERLNRALVWRGDRLDGLNGQTPTCVNPLLGATEAAGPRSEPEARAKLSRGAANATGLPWGARPAFLRREVGAICRNGLLLVSRPDSPALQRRGGFAERRRLPPFNLFYADLEADAERRLQAWRAVGGSARPGPALRAPVEQLGQQP